MIKNKSYNPFKMWGAWVGMVLGLISIPFGGWFILILVGGMGCSGEFCSNSGIQAYLFLGIIGFLIGWGIHSLVRKVRK
ncbi:hypothetical protein GOV13_01315 [Candidatus Pacearchaeota archaeon]|nr:hypothetical protein [Candidatus Pacearchaeota archaeon]